MKVLTISFHPEQNQSVTVICDLGDKRVEKNIAPHLKPIRLSVALDDNNELGDMEVVTTQ